MINPDPVFGLVLAGGGARGAYEAGVMRYIFTELAPKLRVPVNMQVVCGTSAGALNAGFLAGVGSAPGGAIALSRIWQQLEVEQVFTITTFDLLRSPRLLWQVSAEGDKGGSLLDARPLHALVRRHLPADQIRQRVAEGLLRALVIAATEVATGRCVLFMDHDSRHELGPISLHEELRRTAISAEHVLASAAIPFLFSPVSIDGRYFLDGGLRQNTPLSPALMLGADRVLVVSVNPPFEVTSAAATNQGPDGPPSLAFLLGKALNALMIDPLEQDLKALQQFNALFAWGTDAYGPEFMTRLNAAVRPTRGVPFRPVRALHIQPREDLGRLAGECFRRSPPRASRATRYFIKLIADDEESQADVLSYVMFDREYTGLLEQMGYEDGRAREEQLAAFFLGE